MLCHFSFYVWEIMHATIKKMNKHIMRLQKEVDDARDRYDAHQRKVRKVCEGKSIVMNSSVIATAWCTLVGPWYSCDLQ